MSDFDLSRLPKGELGRLALLDYVRSSDDRVERYFLEVKSDVDLTTKEGRAKVAKFILGAANRDKAKAAKRFDGHALMVLGVGDGDAAGVGAFEAMDLANEVRKFAGADGPGWDFERIPLPDGRDVIVVIVDPPTGAVLTCLADGPVGLVDGGIYVRGDGDTRRATGDEIRQMISRSTMGHATVDVGVEVIGKVMSYAIETQPFLDAIDWQGGAMARKAPSILGSMDRRSRATFIAELEAWRTAVWEDPLSGPRTMAAHMLDGIQIRVVNRAKTFLRDIRLEIEFDAPVTAIEWLSPLDPSDPFDLLPGRPKAWGTETLGDLLYPFSQNDSMMPRLAGTGVAEIECATPAQLVLTLNDLRPAQTRTSGDDEVVLVILPAAEAVESVTARWRLTVAEVHEVFDGVLKVPVQHIDVDAAAMLAGDGGTTD
ncbi:hypothetical protein KVF89_22445 [Nocardioides carbamazepini]|uniref:hypothetical protein n=1 Tax=Nocardioides carbamazepini TaxID=2854259 RepID=UPI00214A00C3|nr:hypothetical protein [Nocardioides carbamazepini]MCR1785317.1 hypothetical protein [Nocardioides carbamazepini]